MDEPHLGQLLGRHLKCFELQSEGGQQDNERSKRLAVQRRGPARDRRAVHPAAHCMQIRSTVAAVLDAGLSPKENIIFKQSDVQLGVQHYRRPPAPSLSTALAFRGLEAEELKYHALANIIGRNDVCKLQ
ncbi:Tryptophan-trna ligase [Globisporangium polare]